MGNWFKLWNFFWFPIQKAEEGNDLFGMADLRYYIRKAEEEEFKVDYETVKQYFPMGVVTAGLLQIYQDLLGVAAYVDNKTPLSLFLHMLVSSWVSLTVRWD